MQVETKELQNKLLDIMKQFHNICEENGYTYFLGGGSLIGAVRHNGFIPWDDDMDIGMPREDYERFKKDSFEVLPDNLELRFYENTPNCPFHFIKLIDRNTTLIENNYRNYVEGVYIDVFPIDGVSDSLNNTRKLKKKADRYNSLIVNHLYTHNRKGIRKIYGIFAKCWNVDALHNKLEKSITKYSYSNSNYMMSFLGSYGMKEYMPKSYIGKPIPHKFEDTYFYIPAQYDIYLRTIYGDYMKLPPKEKQINKHQYYYISLTKPYKEYVFDEK